MPSYGIKRQEAGERAAGPKRLKTMTIRMPAPDDPSAGHVVEHEHQPPHKPERFQFATNGELAAHIEKHLGIKLPGKAGESAEPEVSKSNFEGRNANARSTEEQ